MRKAEKIIIENNKIQKISKDIKNTDLVAGEFAGLFYCSDIGIEILKKFHDRHKNNFKLFQSGKSVEQCDLIDLIQELIDYGYAISYVDIAGEWAELEDEKDVIQFIFENKAKTLSFLEKNVKKSKILPQISFSIKQWYHNKSETIQNVMNSIKSSLVVRSSCAFEDQEESSMAGAFCSVLDVKNDTESIENAVKKVINSYGKLDDLEIHDVLIQPFLKDVIMSGVIFSCDLKNGSPYFSLTYEETCSTDGITSGTSESMRHLYILRDIPLESIKDNKIKKLLIAVKELEKVINLKTLDIEFAFDKDEQLYIFQVRPLSVTDSIVKFYHYDISLKIGEGKKYLESILQRKHNLAGEKTILTDMSDWNPVEMIGVNPSQLAISLYQYIITDHAWRIARERIGYKNVSPERLMRIVCGHPYIDARVSFNSMLPEGLTKDLENKIIDCCIERLHKNPELYDKVEFEILITCLSPEFDKKIEPFIEYGLSSDEIDLFKNRLKNLTNEIICGNKISIEDLYNSLNKLEEDRISIINEKNHTANSYYIVKLLDNCIINGTTPFSILARYAFIATTFLKDFVNMGVVSQDEVDSFLTSFSTIAGEMALKFKEVENGDIDLNEFLKDYGHLRPGTYDILSPRYDEAPELYFSHLTKNHKKRKKEKSNNEQSEFNFSPQKIDEMNQVLKKCGFDFEIGHLLNFIKRSIQGREYGKFIFTKTLSDALSCIKDFLSNIDISLEDAPSLSIYEIQEFATKQIEEFDILWLKESIFRKKEEYKHNKQVIMPSIIHSVDNLDIVRMNENQPNFITSKVVHGESIFLDNIKKSNINLNDKIILIENADPGFDWIFTHSISGLITKYGGAASHMAIRCAEFSIPAAIGCGELLFEELKGKKTIQIDCEKHIII